MTRRKLREEVEELARSSGMGNLDGYGVAWGAPVGGRAPLFFRQRRHHVVVRGANDLILARPRWRKPLDREDIVARIPLRGGALRRERHLGLLRQLVVADSAGGSAYALEFPLRNRRFAAELAAILA